MPRTLVPLPAGLSILVLNRGNGRMGVFESHPRQALSLPLPPDQRPALQGWINRSRVRQWKRSNPAYRFWHSQGNSSAQFGAFGVKQTGANARSMLTLEFYANHK